MFIQFKKLEDAGYHVDVDEKGLVIEPKNHNTVLAGHIGDALDHFTDLRGDQKESIIIDAMNKAQYYDIMNIVID